MHLFKQVYIGFLGVFLLNVQPSLSAWCVSIDCSGSSESKCVCLAPAEQNVFPNDSPRQTLIAEVVRVQSGYKKATLKAKTYGHYDAAASSAVATPGSLR